MQRGCALIQVGSRAAFWDPTYPQYSGRGNSGII
jgi:hypothetical protein